MDLDNLKGNDFMTQVINEQPVVINPTSQIAEQVQHAVNTSVQNWNNFLRGVLVNDGSNGLWNGYVKGLMEAQNVVQKINQTILQAYGLPTRADNSQINRQLYEINNRLDELEAKLAAHNVQHLITSETEAIPVIEIAHV